jgi:hypothetical protein
MHTKHMLDVLFQPLLSIWQTLCVIPAVIVSHKRLLKVCLSCHLKYHVPRCRSRTSIGSGGSIMSYPQNAYYISQDFLKQDLVLSTTVEGLVVLRCFAQRIANGLMKQTLVILLHMLPSQETQLNIFSFENWCSSL